MQMKFKTAYTTSLRVNNEVILYPAEDIATVTDNTHFGNYAELMRYTQEVNSKQRQYGQVMRLTVRA